MADEGGTHQTLESPLRVSMYALLDHHHITTIAERYQPKNTYTQEELFLLQVCAMSEIWSRAQTLQMERNYF